MGRAINDEEAADFYAVPANQDFDPTQTVRRPLADSIPVRFAPDVLDQVRAVAAAEGTTVSHWVRQAVTDALAASPATAEDPTTIARQLERLARQLRRSA